MRNGYLSLQKLGIAAKGKAVRNSCRGYHVPCFQASTKVKCRTFFNQGVGDLRHIVCIMAFIRPVQKQLPDGTLEFLRPYHISYEGLERCIMCRDDADCDTLVKCIAVCAQRKNVKIIIYAVVSNHAHIAVLAASLPAAEAYAVEVKRTYSQLFQRKYGEKSVLRHTDVKVQAIDTDWYLRNALAYIPRNAYDNGARSLPDYKWTGFRAFFRKSVGTGLRQVSRMTTREWRDLFHTGDNLGNVSWLVNAEGELEPSSFCDAEYLEAVFNRDETFFYRCIGSVNTAEMTQHLVVNPRKRITDADFFKEIELLSQRWFSVSVSQLPLSQKIRLIPYVNHTILTSVPQLSRGFGISREEIERLLHKV